MTVEITIGYDVRHWVRLAVKDATPDEIETLSDGEAWPLDAMELAERMYQEGRLTEVSDYRVGQTDYFDRERSDFIDFSDFAERED